MSNQAIDRNFTPRERSPATRARRGLVLALACAAVAIVGIDVAIVNVALASIQHDLGVDHGTLQWVVVAYGLLLGGFLLLAGRIADQFGQRRVFLTGIAIFTGASLLAGIAEYAVLLIVARGVQGLGAALIVPAALSLLAVTFAEGPERDRAVGIFGAVDGVAASAGVVGGGVLAAGLGWRWAFFIHVPVGTALFVASLMFLPGDRPDERASRLDVAGAVTVTSGLLAFVYALHHAASHGWFTWSTLALFIAAVALLAVFVRIEARAVAPLVPAAMLRNRTRAAANLTAFLAFSALLALIFIGSLLMQQVLGYSPAIAGLAWLATTATIFVTAMTGTRLVGRVGGRTLLIIGLSLVAVGAFWLARVPRDAGYVTDLLPAFLLAGVGFGFCGPALQLGALSGVSRSDAGLASGLVETSREIGGAAGVAAVTTVLVTGSELDSFHAAFTVVGVLAVLGLVVAATGYAGRERELA
ncbi:MFS transporter [Kribbella sp. HUAS MG21]|uniref:MFS transporter n=1 Tax=Kribbella sp. HUAS MG21 TaxID=3160966 RepID=A0AAU7T7K0_9ACTN